jgi:general secretion pathway protein D
LASHQPSNSLIVADRPQNMRRLNELVRRLDQAGTQDVEVIALENASADEVVRMLSSLNQAAQAVGGAPPIQVIADTRTNSVLLSGTGATRLQMRALIAHLDTPSAEGGDTLVRYLNYADAEDLATKLQAQFGGGGSAPAAPAEGGAGVASGPITIWADPGTNALVINAPERIRGDMNAIINQIDIPRLQVQVDAIIVEVSEKKAAELGVTWLTRGGGDDQTPIGFTNCQGGILTLANLGSDPPNTSVLAEGLTLGIGSISDAGTSWAALLSALRGDADTNVVSTPQIVTLDNEEAEIRVGQEVPFLTGQFTNTGASAAR